MMNKLKLLEEVKSIFGKFACHKVLQYIIDHLFLGGTKN